MLAGGESGAGGFTWPTDSRSHCHFPKMAMSRVRGPFNNSPGCCARRQLWLLPSPRVRFPRTMATFYDRFLRMRRTLAESHTALEIQGRDRVESCTLPAELKQMTGSIGRWLAEGGFKNGARLAIFAENHPRWVAALPGGNQPAGCTVVPLDTALHADQVTKLLKDSRRFTVLRMRRHSNGTGGGRRSARSAWC